LLLDKLKRFFDIKSRNVLTIFWHLLCILHVTNCISKVTPLFTGQSPRFELYEFYIVQQFSTTNHIKLQRYCFLQILLTLKIYPNGNVKAF
jgi:hypothetical protein